MCIFCSVISFRESKLKTLIYLCDLVFGKSNFKISDLIVTIFAFQLQRENLVACPLLKLSGLHSSALLMADCKHAQVFCCFKNRASPHFTITITICNNEKGAKKSNLKSTKGSLGRLSREAAWPSSKGSGPSKDVDK